MHFDQPTFDTIFYFRRTRAAKTQISAAEGERLYDGQVQIKFIIDGTSFGPYSTGINTYHSAWVGRLQTRKPDELTRTLLEVETLAKTAHKMLSRHDTPITGQLLINYMSWLKDQQRQSHTQQAGTLAPSSCNPEPGRPLTLRDVYEQFITTKQGQVENDRTKRHDRLISESTLSTYPKRWALIQGYLIAIRRPQMLAADMGPEFAGNFFDWMLSQKKPDNNRYGIATINKAISFLKMLMSYAKQKRIVRENPIRDYACRGSSPVAPKPLTEEQMVVLEHVQLPTYLRHVCDSWLVAAELCLHHADFMRLPKMEIVMTGGNHTGKPIRRYIQHDRQKQSGNSLIQTVNITDRAERILAKWGIRGLYYGSSGVYSRNLKKVATLAGLVDGVGNVIALQFGQGRDTGLTNRAINGANGIQLSKIAGWSKPSYANRYIGDGLGIVDAFSRRDE